MKVELEQAKQDIAGSDPKEYIRKTYKFPKKFEDFTQDDHKMLKILTSRHTEYL